MKKDNQSQMYIKFAIYLPLLAVPANRTVKVYSLDVFNKIIPIIP